MYLAPDLIDPASQPDDQSAEAVIAAASDAIRAIGNLSAEHPRHPTATLATDITFATPDALRSFLEDVATLAAGYDQGSSGLAMRMTLLAHLSSPNQGAAP